MHESAKRIFELMFRPGETVCVSDSKYGYHSIPLENAINGPVILVPPSDKYPNKEVSTDSLTLVALNPIKGFRQDINCTVFRNFLVEMDYGPLPEQIAYVKKLGMPYSAAIFSGNKSIHFLVSLDTDLPSEKVYRHFSEWILNVATLADENTKNPSRSIRIPGAYRDSNKKQVLVEYKGPVKVEELVEWLKKYPDAMPKQRKQNTISEAPDMYKIKPWVSKALVEGVKPPNRNKQWFSIAVEFALSGYDEDDTIDRLSKYFEPERDFKEREWRNAIKSGFKWTYERR